MITLLKNCILKKHTNNNRKLSFERNSLLSLDYLFLHEIHQQEANELR